MWLIYDKKRTQDNNLKCNVSANFNQKMSQNMVLLRHFAFWVFT